MRCSILTSTRNSRVASLPPCGRWVHYFAFLGHEIYNYSSSTWTAALCRHFSLTKLAKLISEEQLYESELLCLRWLKTSNASVFMFPFFGVEGRGCGAGVGVGGGGGEGEGCADWGRWNGQGPRRSSPSSRVHRTKRRACEQAERYRNWNDRRNWEDKRSSVS